MVMIQIFVELKFCANVTELGGPGSMSSARTTEKQGQPLIDESLGGFPYHIAFGGCSRQFIGPFFFLFFQSPCIPRNLSIQA